MNYIFENYKSPIMVYNEIENQILQEQENQIMCKIKTVVDVDKQELIKALNYDKAQYQCGYQAAVRKYVKHGHWKRYENNYNMAYWYSCSICGIDLPVMAEKTKYCPNCGAEMGEKE